MKIFLAGNSGHGKAGEWRENMLREVGANRLFSFFWVGEGKDFNKHFIKYVKEKKNGTDTMLRRCGNNRT